MKWNFAVPYADVTSRKRLGEMFGVQGIPTLVLVTRSGHVVSMKGVKEISEDSEGCKYPWGKLEPSPASDAMKEDAITYLGVRYNRPFVWYHNGVVFPENPPAPEPSEAWAVHLLQPVLEALFPQCPNTQMKYVLYMPEAISAESSDELVLLGMSDEDKDFATWKEVRVNKTWNVVHCFNLVSHGRRVFRTQVWSSDGARSFATMRPMHLRPSCSAIQPCILDATGDWKLNRNSDPSLVIARLNRNIGGRETYLPPRLLTGVVPGAFLESHQFWQSEDLAIRGYPNNSKDEWFPYALEIKLLEGSRAQIIQCRPDKLSTLVLKGLTTEPVFQKNATAKKQDCDVEAVVNRVPSRNTSATTRLAPLLEMGFTAEQASYALDRAKGPDGRENYDIAAEFLLQNNPSPVDIKQLQEAKGTAPITSIAPVLERGGSATGGVAGRGEMVSQAHIPEPFEYVLMDLFNASIDSPLHRLAKVFARVEDLGHILVWARPADSQGPAEQVHQIVLIELPRLKLKFQPRELPDGTVKVYSLDHTDWFLSDLDLTEMGDEAVRNLPRSRLLATLLANMPHSLLLENATKELQVLVPAWELGRPKEAGAPFGTHLVFNRASEEWANIFSNTRCFLYPVHATRAFLMPKTLDAQLYLILMRFYGRQYAEAHRWATSIAVDVEFSGPEYWVYRQLHHVADGHPDAHALRMRLFIAIRFSPDAEKLGASEKAGEFDAYLRKHAHVSAGCALTPLEEFHAIGMLKNSTPSITIRRKMLQSYLGGSPTVTLSAPDFRVGGEPWQKLVSESRERFEAAEWGSRFKFVIPSEEVATNLADAEALKVLIDDENLFIDDDEAGNTRKLGFLFLYALAIGQLKITLGGRECGKSMAQILTRAMQLKLAHWGKRAQGTELEARLSKQCAVLSLVFDFPATAWPRLPLPGSDEPIAPAAASSQTSASQEHVEEIEEPARKKIRASESEKLYWMNVDCADTESPAKKPRTSAPSEEEKVRDTYTVEEVGSALKLLAECFNFDAPIHEREKTSSKGLGKVALSEWFKGLKAMVSRVMESQRVVVNREVRRQSVKKGRAIADDWICAPHEVNLAALASKIEPPFTPSDLGCDSCALRPFTTESLHNSGLSLPAGIDLSVSSARLHDFAAMPLGSIAGPKNLMDIPPKNGDDVVCPLPFPVKEHSAATAPIAKDMLARLERDLGVYQKDKRDKRDVRLLGLESSDIEAICSARDPDSCTAKNASNMLHEIITSLNAAHESETQYLEHAVTLAAKWAQSIPEGSSDAENVERMKFRLKQRAGLVLELGYEMLVMMGMSTKASEDLSRYNPFVRGAPELMGLVFATELHANRLAQNARSSAAAVGLEKDICCIQKEISKNGKPTDAQKVKLPHSVSGLLLQLAARRHCLELTGAEGSIDPRLLMFEFLSTFLLRERQVEMVRSLKSRALQGESSCQQMIMGAGKTTVVGPLLVLCLADGNTPVLQTMPSALLEMTRNVLREVFCYPLAKQVFTLQFDRTQDEIKPVQQILEKLELARNHRGVVVAAPETIKSLTLKMIEMLHSLDDKGGVSMQDALVSGGGCAAMELNEELKLMVHRSEMADSCAKVLSQWRQGVVIMDEVDVLLHPLRSELNFPIGEKVPVDLSGDRWELPLHLLGLVFIEELTFQLEHESPVESKEWAAAEEAAGESRKHVAAAFKDGLRKGIDTFSFQKNPHVTLMDIQFYQASLARVFARFALLWIHRLSTELSGLLSNDVILDYLTGTVAEPGKPALTDEIVGKLNTETMKRLNLAADWIVSIMPHCLSRVNRVAYGLLGKNDKQPPSAPESRRLMAVPFLAKDVPSMNSEFAHPDVVIGLTILAYRHEGLRIEDLHRIVKSLKSDFAKQIGNRSTRPANLTFENWREEGRSAWARNRASETSPAYQKLELFQPEDSTQMANLHQLLNKRPHIVYYYLTRMVFPDTMNFHHLKISACGHELGSSMIFDRRIGFSGTPSNLLPEDLKPCMFEPGSEGKIIEVLTDPAVISCGDVQSGWSARSLLQQIAKSEPPYHALIDTGALVTGMENVEVAQYLLEELPEWFQGVVYLDRSDRQMVLLRSSGRSSPLKQCGLPLDRRFTFYDQIHTTGMDIKQAPNARAALTIGKDMVFRDLAQGAWRMRGIAIGQTITLMIIPEVKKKIQQDLNEVKGLFKADRWQANVPAWLLLNSMRMEGLQDVQSNLQELHNVYRKRALQTLLADAASSATEDQEVRSARFAVGDERADKLHSAIEVFRETISNDLETKVPVPKSLRETFDEIKAQYVALGVKDHLGMTDQDEHRLEQVRSRTAGGSSEDTKLIRGGLEAEREQQQEKEQEQSQMREKEQEEEQMAQFSRDNEEPFPWTVGVLMKPPSNQVETKFIKERDAGISFPFSKLVVGDDAFYPLALFHATDKQPQLPFPRHVYLSSNYFRPRWAGLGDRRLKNIFLIIEWVLEDNSRVVLVPSLSEAETIRRLIHNGEYGVELEKGRLEKQPLTISVAVRTLNGFKLDATSSFTDEAEGSTDLLTAVQCIRFFHGEMFFSDDELKLLMSSLAACEPDQRKEFFEECIRRRRRERREWIDTPLARALEKESAWATLRPRALIKNVHANVAATLTYVTKRVEEIAKLEAVARDHAKNGLDEQASTLLQKITDIQSEVKKYPKDIKATFDLFDLDEAEGLLSRTELQCFFAHFNVHPTMADMSGILELLGGSGCTALNFQQFKDAFEPVRDATGDDENPEALPWHCTACNNDTLNAPENIRCVFCSKGWKPGYENVDPSAPALPGFGCPSGKWTCNFCTFHNDDRDHYCTVCANAKDAVPPASAAFD
jgi:hypothetical protein